MSTKQRNSEIFALKERGMTFSELGIQFKLSSSRIKQIYDKEKRHKELEQSHIDAINGNIPYTFYDALLDVCETENQVTRIFRCLCRTGILYEIENNNASLDSYSDETLLSIRHFGQMSLEFSRRANELFKKKQSNF